MHIRHRITSALILLILAAPAVGAQDIDALFNGTVPGVPGGDGIADEPEDYLATQAITDQGARLARYGKYVHTLAQFASDRGLSEEVAIQLEQHAQQIDAQAQRLMRADVVRITSDEAATAVSVAVAALGKSLRLMGESSRDTALLQNGSEGMLQIGQSMLRVATNMKRIADDGRKNGGNLNLGAYTTQLEAVEYLLTAVKYLNRSLNYGKAPEAKITASVSAERGTTYQLISFSALDSVDAVGTIDRVTGYFWDFGDGEFATGAFVTHLFDEPNNYLVHLYVLGPSGFDMDETTIKVQPVRPVAVISTDQEKLVGPHDDLLTITQGQTVLFNAKNSFDPSDPRREFSHLWDFGDGTTDDVQSDAVYHAFPDAREYTVVLLVTTPDNVSASAVKRIRVLPPPPEAVFSIRRDGDSLEAGIAKDFFIDHTSGTRTLLFNASKSRGAPGSRPGTRAKLTNAQWNFDDESSVVEQTERDLATGVVLAHVFKKPGRYDVTVTMTDSQGSEAKATKTVILLEPDLPTADFTLDVAGEVTTHRTVTFDASASSPAQDLIVGYQWEMRLVKQEVLTTGSGKVFQASFDRPGVYQVALTTKDANGEESPRVVQQLQVLSTAPRAAFAFRRSPDEPNVFVFDASLSRDADPDDTLSYSWDFNSDGTYEEVKRSTSRSSFLYDRIGASTVTLRVTDGFNRSATATRAIQVDSTLVARVQADPSTPRAGATPLRVTFLGAAYLNLAQGHDVNNVRSVAWDFGDGLRETYDIADGASTVTHTYATAGNYTVVLTATDAFGNRRRTSTTVVAGAAGEVLPLLTVNPELPERGTTSTTYRFSAAESVSARGLRSGLSATWDYGDGSALSNGLTVQHVFRSAGTYTVTLSLTDETSGKYAKTSRTVEVLREPASAFFFAGPADGIAPLVVNFDATASRDPQGAIRSFVWNFGDGAVFQQNAAKTSYTYRKAGTYVVRLTIVDSAGSKVDAEPVTITVR